MALRTTPIDARSIVSDSHRRRFRLGTSAKGLVAPVTHDASQERAARAGSEPVRKTLRSAQDDKAGLSARLVQVKAPADGPCYPPPAVGARTYFEVVTKVPKQSEVTRTFSRRANAEQVYEIATHGITDLGTPLLDLHRAFWKGKREIADRVLAVPGFTNGPDPSFRAWDGQPVHDLPQRRRAGRRGDAMSARPFCRCAGLDESGFPAPGRYLSLEGRPRPGRYGKAA